MELQSLISALSLSVFLPLSDFRNILAEDEDEDKRRHTSYDLLDKYETVLAWSPNMTSSVMTTTTSLFTILGLYILTGYRVSQHNQLCDLLDTSTKLVHYTKGLMEGHRAIVPSSTESADLRMAAGERAFKSQKDGTKTVG